ncbi:MAG: hypothetical protein R3F05_05775 [Planctomycetota bacterium]
MKRHAPWLLLVVLVLLLGGGAAITWLGDLPRHDEGGAGLASLQAETPVEAHQPGLVPGQAIEAPAAEPPLVGFRLPEARGVLVIDGRQQAVPGVRVHLVAEPLPRTETRHHVELGSGRLTSGRREREARRVASWVTDDRGRFELPPRWSHASGLLIAEPGNGHLGGVASVSASGGSSGDIVLTVAPGRVLQGRVLGASGEEPGGFIACSAIHQGYVEEPLVWSPIAGDGRFETEGPADKPVGFSVEDTAGARWSRLCPAGAGRNVHGLPAGARRGPYGVSRTQGHRCPERLSS